MWRILLGLLVVAHGVVTVAIWASPTPASVEGRMTPPDPAHSWIFGDARALSVELGIAVGLALVLAGIGFLTDQSWWPSVAVGAGAASLLLFGMFFTPWWAAGIAISVAAVIAGLRAGTLS
ncbi:MAG: hypothetical protein ACRDKT_15515 [Actinomycetota bacterium]